MFVRIVTHNVYRVPVGAGILFATAHSVPTNSRQSDMFTMEGFSDRPASTSGPSIKRFVNFMVVTFSVYLIYVHNKIFIGLC